MSIYEIRNHFLYKNGKQVPYKSTPTKFRGLDNPKGLIYHDTASGLNIDGPVRWLRNPVAKASAHLVLGRDGELIQLAPFNYKTWHAGESEYVIDGVKYEGLNDNTIGLEIVNPGGLVRLAKGIYKPWFRGKVYKSAEYDIVKSEKPTHPGFKYWMDYTVEQISVCMELGAVFTEHYGFNFLGTHWMISPGRKTDTNPLFPIDKIRERVSGRADAPLKFPETWKAEEEAESFVTFQDGVDPKVRDWLKTQLDEMDMNARSNVLRKYPGPYSTPIMTIENGTKMRVLHRGHSTAGDDWWKVRTKGKTGWLFRGSLDGS